MLERPRSKANYSFGIIHGLDSDDTFLWITDEGGDMHMTVTNDAENVIGDILMKGHFRDQDITKVNIVYRDSRGIWDQMIVKRSQATGRLNVDFRCLNCQTRENSIKKVLGLS